METRPNGAQIPCLVVCSGFRVGSTGIVNLLLDALSLKFFKVETFFLDTKHVTFRTAQDADFVIIKVHNVDVLDWLISDADYRVMSVWLVVSSAKAQVQSIARISRIKDSRFRESDSLENIEIMRALLAFDTDLPVHVIDRRTPHISVVRNVLFNLCLRISAFEVWKLWFWSSRLFNAWRVRRSSGFWRDTFSGADERHWHPQHVKWSPFYLRPLSRASKQYVQQIEVLNDQLVSRHGCR